CLGRPACRQPVRCHEQPDEELGTRLPRARRLWARANSFELNAAMIESSPANDKPAQTSANASACSGPAKPRISRHARWLGKLVPPPTVPTIRLGNETDA